MEEKWLIYLRENAPELYQDAISSTAWDAEWRDKKIADLQARLTAAEAVAEAAEKKIKCKGIPALKEGCVKDSFAIRDCDFYELCSALMIWRGKK